VLRTQTGITIAVLTLTAAVFAQGEDVTWLAATLLALTGLIVLGTAAHRLPILHKLPVIGAKRPPKVEFHLEPQGGMTFTLDPARREVVLCVGLSNPGRHEIEKVYVNAYVVGSTSITRCRQDGTPYPAGGGDMLVADAPYWAISRLIIPPDAFVMYFAVAIPAPGSYEVVLKLLSPEFYERGDIYYRDKLVARAADASPTPEGH
jgi:hypothetical protein